MVTKKDCAMTKFVKSEFAPGEYATYNGKFVARFKRGGRAAFISFLVKNFTVEEYFAALEAGEAPLEILQNKGYVSPTVRKALKLAGYPETVEGLKAMVQAQINRYARTGVVAA